MEEAPAGSPAVLQFNPSGNILFGTRFIFANFLVPGLEELFAYQLDHTTGLLTPAPGSPYVPRANSRQPIGFVFNPVDDSQIFVTNANTPGVVGNMSTYIMAESGQISELDFSPVSASTNGQNAIATCWVGLTSNGENLYTTNPFSDDMSRYKALPSGELVLQEVIDIPPANNTLNFPVDVLVTPDDQYIYVLQTALSSIVGWKINADGSLTLLNDQPLLLPPRSFPYGLALIEL